MEESKRNPIKGAAGVEKQESVMEEDATWGKGIPLKAKGGETVAPPPLSHAHRPPLATPTASSP